ncbi:MAG: preprotein translocase subunit YajC [Oscillibacter sp.]|nr:preprotein translocase subunit YajC [Oscillibacter sp.]
METIVMLVLMLGIFYFILIRPENKRKKKAEEMRNSLKKGDKITSIGGIVGSIVQVTDKTIIIETSEDRVRVELTKWAVSTTGVQDSPDEKPEKKKKAAAEEPVNEIPAPEEKTDEPEEKKD